jgi:PIN domain nuclease of toxin-antitoxin system
MNCSERVARTCGRRKSVSVGSEQVVLDASALLALIKGEPGADSVEAALSGSAMSCVNLAEVASVLVQEGHHIEDVRRTLSDYAVDILDFDESQAMETARFRPLTSHAGLSLGDRACLALAALRRLPVMTADRAWARLELGIEIVVIR